MKFFKLFLKFPFQIFLTLSEKIFFSSNLFTRILEGSLQLSHRKSSKNPKMNFHARRFIFVELPNVRSAMLLESWKCYWATKILIVCAPFHCFRFLFSLPLLFLQKALSCAIIIMYISFLTALFARDWEFNAFNEIMVFILCLDLHSFYNKCI